MNTPILALDAAIGPASACLILDDHTLYAESDGSQPHSQIILPLLEGLVEKGGLQWADIQAFALSSGPGSFTGIRVISATIAGFNASLKRPVMRISSLAVIACQANSDEPIWVFEDARADEVFMGRYQARKSLQKDLCISWDDVQNIKPSRFVAHADPVIDMSAWQRYPLSISRSKALEMVVCENLKSLDFAQLPTIGLPTYLQVSQAEKSASRG